MKKLIKIASALLAVITVFSCFSVNAFAQGPVYTHASQTGTYAGTKYHLLSDAYNNYYCLILQCSKKCPKIIESRYMEWDYANGEYKAYYHYKDNGTDLKSKVLADEVFPHENCIFTASSCATFTLHQTAVGCLNPIFCGTYIPEGTDD